MRCSAPRRSQAFFVKCDAETNPPEVIEAGQVICEIGIAPVKPAEFVIFRLSQFTGGGGAEVAGVDLAPFPIDAFLRST